MKHWFVLYVRTGKEEKIVNLINLAGGDFHAFIPKKKQRYRKQGIITIIDEILFKGYVFVESNLDIQEFSIYVSNNIKLSSGFIKLLGNKIEPEYVSVYPEERKVLEQFTNKEKVIEFSVGFIEGDQVIITEGPLKGYESQIKKIDRHKRKAEVEIQLFNQIQRISVPCEIVSKV